MKRKNLYKTNVILLVIFIFAVASSILQEYLEGSHFLQLNNGALVFIHLIICLALFLFIGLHLAANFGKMSKWLIMLKKGKIQNKWLFWFCAVTLLTGLMATVTYYHMGHTGIGGLHGKIGFVALFFMIFHLFKRIKWYGK